ncbi:hypothetical protein [Bradyrhizobium sp. RT9a]|uniref:hypothetical protein n=1 Tax=Bradyrhizobium sp. RT9a TaxID=3156384 RepID=UPI0033914006
MISEGRARALEGNELDEQPPEFGITLADAGRLARKAKLIWISAPLGRNGAHVIFGISKAALRKEIKFYDGGKKTIRPSELEFRAGGPTLIFGSQEAIQRAEEALALVADVGSSA